MAGRHGYAVELGSIGDLHATYGSSHADGGLSVRLTIPDFALVVLIGASGSGKSTFAARHFRETEIVSSDRCRALVGDDESDQSVTPEAFEVLYTIAAKRLEGRRLTVVDATNLRPEDRAHGIALARRYHALPVAIVLDLPPPIGIERNRSRSNRPFGARGGSRSCSLVAEVAQASPPRRLSRRSRPR